MLDVYHLLSQIKTKDVTTILYGESGTGKNLVANTLHKISLRRDRPNVAVNCPAIPSELLESELFGHEKEPLEQLKEKMVNFLLQIQEQYFWMK